MATEFRQGSDVIIRINYQDNLDAAIQLVDLVGYGIEVFDPAGASIGKWGTNLTGYADPTGVYDRDGAATCTLKLDYATYGTNKGVFTCVTFISYTDADFGDSLRHLHSTEIDCFKII